MYGLVGACGLVNRALDSRSEGLGFDSHCWPCIVVLGKLCIPHCFSPPSRNGNLVHRSKVGSIVAGCIGAHLARGKVKSVEHALSWSLDSKQLPLPLHLWPWWWKCEPKQSQPGNKTVSSQTSHSPNCNESHKQPQPKWNNLNLKWVWVWSHWWPSGLSRRVSDMKCTVMIWRSWVLTAVRLNLGCVVLLS